MRYFSATSEILNALRQQVMLSYGMPNDYAAEPWAENTTLLALTEREYTPPEYAALIEAALNMGATEITEAEYIALQPKPEFPL